MSGQENSFLLSTAEELNTNNKSIIAIFIPTEYSNPEVNSMYEPQGEPWKWKMQPQGKPWKWKMQTLKTPQIRM